jgi:hypothetical protein
MSEAICEEEGLGKGFLLCEGSGLKPHFSATNQLGHRMLCEHHGWMEDLRKILRVNGWMSSSGADKSSPLIAQVPNRTMRISMLTGDLCILKRVASYEHVEIPHHQRQTIVNHWSPVHRCCDEKT